MAMMKSALAKIGGSKNFRSPINNPSELSFLTQVENRNTVMF